MRGLDYWRFSFLLALSLSHRLVVLKWRAVYNCTVQMQITWINFISLTATPPLIFNYSWMYIIFCRNGKEVVFHSGPGGMPLKGWSYCSVQICFDVDLFDDWKSPKQGNSNGCPFHCCYRLDLHWKYYSQFHWICGKLPSRPFYGSYGRKGILDALRTSVLRLKILHTSSNSPSLPLPLVVVGFIFFVLVCASLFLSFLTLQYSLMYH